MKKKIVKILAVPSIIILGKMLVFTFDMLLGAYYGAGEISDAFILAHALPTILFDGVATALIVCYIPIYSQMKVDNPDGLEEYSSNMISLSVMFGLLITVIFEILKKPFLGLYAHGFSDLAMNLLIIYAQVVMMSLPFIAAFSILRGYLQVNNHVALSNLPQIITYVVLIISLMLFFPNDESLAYATLGGNIIALLILYTISRKDGFKFHFSVNIHEHYVKSIFFMMLPIFLSSLVSEINSMVDKFFASYYPAGVVTDLSYGYKLSFAIQGVVASSVMSILYPHLTTYVAEKNQVEFGKAVRRSMQIISWICIPLIISGMVLRNPIIKCIYGHGKFTNENVLITASIFGLYLIGVFPMSVKHIFDKACYALNNTKYATISTVISVTVNIVLDYLLSRIFGYIGLVLATDIALFLACFIEYLFLKRLVEAIKSIFYECVKPLLISFFMGVVLLSEYTLIQHNIGRMQNEKLLLLLVGFLIEGIGIYIIAMKVFAMKELAEWKSMIRR